MFRVFVALLQVISLTIIFSPACSAEATGDDKKLQAAMNTFMKKWDLTAGQIAISDGQKIIYSKAFGHSDKDKKVATTEANIFRIASVSKVFTACAIWQLIEAGKLKIDDRAFDILSDLKPLEGAVVDPRLKNITIANLLTHSAGWTLEDGEPQMKYTRLAADLFHEPRPAKPVTIIRYMMGKPLNYDPGAKSVYSNLGFNVLGRVIEKVSGQSYYDYLREHILVPAKITGVALGRTSAKNALPGEVYYHGGNNLGEIWSVLDDETEPVTYPYGGDSAIECLDSHGGLVASAEDLVTFAAAVPTLLKPEILKCMLTPSKYPGEGKGGFRAYGVPVKPGEFKWCHAGALVGTSSYLVVLEDGPIYAVVFNHLPENYGDYFGAMVKTFTPLVKAHKH